VDKLGAAAGQNQFGIYTSSVAEKVGQSWPGLDSACQICRDYKDAVYHEETRPVYGKVRKRWKLHIR